MTVVQIDLKALDISPRRAMQQIVSYRNNHGNVYINTLLSFKADEKLLVMRSYQIYAVKAIVDCIHQNRSNDYVWHTTSSCKTLTSFKVIVTTIQKLGLVLGDQWNFEKATEQNRLKPEHIDKIVRTYQFSKRGEWLFQPYADGGNRKK